jgi:hypothetical protein
LPNDNLRCSIPAVIILKSENKELFNHFRSIVSSDYQWDWNWLAGNALESGKSRFI